MRANPKGELCSTKINPLPYAEFQQIQASGSQTRIDFALRLRELRRPLYRSVPLGKDATGRLKKSRRFRYSLPMLTSQAAAG
jgi:hypothetical protein